MLEKLRLVNVPPLTGSSELCGVDSLEDLMVLESRARPQTRDTHRKPRHIHILGSTINHSSVSYRSLGPPLSPSVALKEGNLQKAPLQIRSDRWFSLFTSLNVSILTFPCLQFSNDPTLTFLDLFLNVK